MSTNPEEIRRDIERTRAELSENVNALGDSAKPSNIVREQVDQVKEGVHSFKERIFGSDTNPYDHGAVGAVEDKAGTLVEDAKETVADAPRQVKASTRGNPLAAGLIAAGLGALIGGLIPASRMEKERAEQLKVAAEPVVEEIKQMATEAKDNLQPLAEEVAGNLKEVAQDATEHVKADAQVAKDEVSGQAHASAETVKSDVTDR
jgi:gas vesicle protein